MTDIEGRTWPTDEGTYLVVDEAHTSDSNVMISVYDKTGDGPSACLKPAQIRALITDLTARVELISRPAMHGTNWDGEAF